MSIGKDGEPTHNFTPSYELRAKYTLFPEGCRGHLGKRLISKFDLDKDADPQLLVTTNKLNSVVNLLII